MLGQCVCRHLHPRHELIAPPRTELDICDHASVRHQIITAHPDWVLHLAALTDVDLCQRQPDLAYKVNTAATANLVSICRNLNLPLLLISSIAVFNGRKPVPYLEDDLPAPLNVYGESKWQAERFVATLPRHSIVRSGWLFGGGVADKKFVSKILSLAQRRQRLTVVNDKIGSPTFTDDLAQGLERLLRGEKYGLMHLVNAGPPVSRFGLAAEILRLAKLATELIPVPSTNFPHLAPRPEMEAAASHYTSDWLRPWPAALRSYVGQLMNS